MRQSWRLVRTTLAADGLRQALLGKRRTARRVRMGLTGRASLASDFGVARFQGMAVLVALVSGIGCAGSEPPRPKPAPDDAPAPSPPRPPPLAELDASARAEPSRADSGDAGDGDGAADSLPEVDDTCFAGISESATALEALSQIAERCTQGMQPVIAEPLVISLKERERRDLPFVVMEAGRCFRVIAAGAHGIEHLRVDVVDREDHRLDGFDDDSRFAVVGPSGPFCVDAPGSYRAIAHVRAGSGEVALQVYQAR